MKPVSTRCDGTTCDGVSCEGQDVDVAGYILRARRLGDLSQRGLAAMVGMTQPTIAKIEGGRQQVNVSQFARMMKAGGLRLAVVDADGAEVRPVSPRVVRDNAGRRFPAHLDLTPPDQLPPERIRSPRYDREPAKAWYHLRETRDRLRAEADGEEPMDHLTPEGIRWRRRERLEAMRTQGRRRAAARKAAKGVVDRDCGCETECWGGTACVPRCECQCDPG